VDRRLADTPTPGAAGRNEIMSAFIVPMEHIRAMVNAGLNIKYGPMRWGNSDLTEANADQVGAMLVAENRRSVNYRYSERKKPEVYTHRSSSARTPVEILKAISCYEYQSCETPDWKQSEAAAFCEMLRVLMVHQLPGMDEADTWPIMKV